MKTIYTIIGYMLVSFVSFGQEQTSQTKTGGTEKELITSVDQKKDVDTVSIEFVGDGNIQKSLNDGAGIPANTGVGVIFKRVWLADEVKTTNGTCKRLTSDIEVDFSINVASTVDTISAVYANGNITNRRDFGTQVLLPTNSGQAFKFSYYQYFKPESMSLFKVLSGVNLNLAASNRVWKDSLTATNVATFSARLGAYHDFFPNNMRLENNYAIRVGSAFTYRGILGDGGLDNSSSNQFREGLLGTNDLSYFGVEMFAELKFDNIVLGVSLPYMFGNQNIQGLSGTQFVTSIAFVGGFPLKLKKGAQTEQTTKR